MMTEFNFVTEIPKENIDLRQSIYKGDIYKLPSSEMSLALAQDIYQSIEDIFGNDMHNLHKLGDHEVSLEKLDVLKNALKEDSKYGYAVHALMMEKGFKPSENLDDYMRLRANVPGGYKNEAAKVAYAAHRDTWYANPQSQMNWWIALHDILPEQGFIFYPSYFNKPVKNNSSEFKYEEWIEGGYPEAQEALENPVKFFCKAGEIVLFSAAHLHQTSAHNNEHVRYSVDFRTVHIRDQEQGLGAPNADNGSAPKAMDDYAL